VKRAGELKRQTPAEVRAWRERSKPLERGKPLRRSTSPKPRIRPKQKGELTPRQRHRAALTEITGGVGPCSLCFLDGDCDGPLQDDHIIEVHRLKDLQGNARIDFPGHPITQVDIDELIADARNGWWVCEHHHGLKTYKLRRIPRDFLPLSVEEFAAEYGIERALDKAFGPKGAPA